VTFDPSNPGQPPRASQAPRLSQAPHPSQPPRLSQSAAPDARELVRSARNDAPTPGTLEASMEQVLLRYHRRRRFEPLVWAASGTAVALAAAVAIWINSNPLQKTELAREQHRPAPSQRSALPGAPSASARPAELEPCTPAMRAQGNDPLIDDFEDGDPRIAPLEHRAGFWSASNDNTATQRPTLRGPLSMARIPGGRGTSQFALHTSGGRFTKWGALLAADFSPRRCYDASVYAGLTFFARGRGSINVVAKMTQVAPEEYGGSCKHDCYDSHHVTISLSNDWKEQRVTWAELQQKGFGQIVPFDPRSLLSLEFSVAPEQTPFDFWVDDVRFLQR
jgi:hypothetical protein